MAMTTNAILDFAETVDMARNNETQQWQAVMNRDPSQDGKFVFAVSSTGVYCRPSCAARRPRRENVAFFSKPEEAEKSGYRACLRCRPKAVGNAQSNVTVHLLDPLPVTVPLSATGNVYNMIPQGSDPATLGIRLTALPTTDAHRKRRRSRGRASERGDSVLGVISEQVNRIRASCP